MLRELCFVCVTTRLEVILFRYKEFGNVSGKMPFWCDLVIFIVRVRYLFCFVVAVRFYVRHNVQGLLVSCAFMCSFIRVFMTVKGLFMCTSLFGVYYLWP